MLKTMLSAFLAVFLASSGKTFACCLQLSPRAASTGSMLTMPIKLGYELSVPPHSVSCSLSCVYTLSWQNP
ncbi:hypothetical protein ACOMHN_033168 [Nucella lapillus]